jgi:hypothetical protein
MSVEKSPGSDITQQGERTEQIPESSPNSLSFDPDSKIEPSGNICESLPDHDEYSPESRVGASDDAGVEVQGSSEKIDENGYRYKYDDEGRTLSAEGFLLPKSHIERYPMNISMDEVGKGNQLSGDEKGHLIADRFEGKPISDNLVPMSHEANVAFGRVEDVCADALKNGSEVFYKVDAKYQGDSNRPDEFEITYVIDGEEKHAVISNEGSDL